MCFIGWAGQPGLEWSFCTNLGVGFVPFKAHVVQQTNEQQGWWNRLSWNMAVALQNQELQRLPQLSTAVKQLLQPRACRWSRSLVSALAVIWAGSCHQFKHCRTNRVINLVWLEPAEVPCFTVNGMNLHDLCCMWRQGSEGPNTAYIAAIPFAY